MIWKETSEGIEFLVKITPKADRNQILGWENGELKIRIAAIPEKGAANAELIRFFAKEMKISKSQVFLLNGESSRHKRLKIVGENLNEVKNRLQDYHNPL